MAIRRTQFENSSDIGVFTKLTNAYCLIAKSGKMHNKTFETELAGHIPIIYTSVAETNLVGSYCAGNKNGLLVPHTTTDQELQTLKNYMPDKVEVQRVDEKLTALGNVILCNDYVALVHPDIDKDTEEIIADVLGVEVFRQTICKNVLVGTYGAISNKGGIVPPKTPKLEIEELSALLQVPLVSSTVNRGSTMIGSGLVVNDWIGFAGMDTTIKEIAIADSVFKLQGNDEDTDFNDVRTSLIDDL